MSIKYFLNRTVESISLIFLNDFLAVLSCEMMKKNTLVGLNKTLVEILRNLIKKERKLFFPFLNNLIKVILKFKEKIKYLIEIFNLF